MAEAIELLENKRMREENHFSDFLENIMDFKNNEYAITSNKWLKLLDCWKTR